MSPPAARPVPGPARRIRRFPAGRGAGLLLAGLVWLAGPAAAAERVVGHEYQIKAAFLYNFTKFVEWPAACFADPSSPIIIGVVGQDPFGGELEKIVNSRTVNGRALRVKPIRTAEDVSAVHLLFVPAGEETRLRPAVWQKAAILAVGESPGFTALGGTITFTQARDRLRFEINITTAERSGLKVSAQLQKLATVVRRQP